MCVFHRYFLLDFPSYWYFLTKRWGVFGLLVLAILGSPGFGYSHDAGKPNSSSLQWHEWGEEAFRLAQAEDRLILLDLTAVWCHACHVMDQTTYQDPQVLQLLNEQYVAIRVDTDERPDLDARYRAGGWPTTSVLLPTGEILFQANALEPQELREVLQQVHDIYRTDKADLLTEAEKIWEQVQARMTSKPRPSEGPLNPSVVTHAISMMRAEFDHRHGGFRKNPKFFEPDAVRFALAYGFLEKDLPVVEMGLQTLDRQTALLDPEWGGFYRYAEQEDWTDPHYEKMLAIQGQNLRSYVEGYQLTKNPEYKYVAERIIDYVENFLRDTQSGKYFESQDADLRGPYGRTIIRGQDYFQWDRISRKARGFPRIDRRSFTGSNAQIAEAYLMASLIFEKPALKDRAQQVIRSLMEERFDQEHGLGHMEEEGMVSLFGLLSNHVLLGHALLEGYRVTEDPYYLVQARRIADWCASHLLDPEGGGFFDSPSTPDSYGLLKMPNKPMQENIRAAQLYLQLFHMTLHLPYRSLAEQTLQAVLQAKQPLPISLIGFTVNQWFRTPIHIAVLGAPQDPVTQALWLEAQKVFCPGKILRRFDPLDGEARWGDITFPYTGKPVAFVCTDRLCSPPIFQKGMMQDQLKEMVAVVKEQT